MWAQAQKGMADAKPEDVALWAAAARWAAGATRPEVRSKRWGEVKRKTVVWYYLNTFCKVAV